MNFLATLLAKVAQALLPWLLAKLMAYLNKEKSLEDNKEKIDELLVKVKEAYKKAFNGQPVTPEQEQELKRALRDFIRG
jgi:hypothetical protein